MKCKAKEDFKYISYEIKSSILYAKYKKGNVNYSSAIQIIEDRLTYTNGKNYPVIVRSDERLTIDKLAKAYFMSDDGIRGLTSVAMIYEKPYTQIAISFLMRFYKSPIPMKVFRNEEDAIVWTNSLSND